MKSFKVTIKSLVMAAMVAGAFACSKSEGGGEGGGNEYDYTDIIDTYVDDVVIPTYADMKDNAWVLLEKVNAYNAEQSQANLQAVCNAWLAVREPWELSEAFLYGPCGEDGLNVDPNIDTWPFDEVGLAQILGGSDPITVTAVSGYNETLRGYHTIEYLIFDDGAPRTTQLSARELQYLVSATTVLRNDCIRVWAAWYGLSGISAKDQGAITGMGSYWDVPAYLQSKNASSYAYIFKNAKRPYTSKSDVFAEMIAGCCEIAGEVSEGKIDTPNNDPNGVIYVESRYAWNSLVDFTDNIKGIRNAYYGYRTDNVEGWTSGSAEIIDNSMAGCVLAQDGGQAVHDDIVSAIDNAIARIGAIDYPFTRTIEQNLDDADINAAVTACTDVQTAFLAIKGLMELD